MTLWRCLPLPLLLIATVARAADDRPLVISGNRQLPTSFVRRTVGLPPPNIAARYPWSEAAVKRVVAAYRKRGYSYARAWTRIDANGNVRIDVDEGRMSLAFAGAGTFRSILYRVDLYLPDNIFHHPTLERARAELMRKHKLVNVHYRVTEGRPLISNGFGEAVKQRILHIYVVTRERFGWGINVSLSSTWGIVPEGSLSLKDVLLRDDRFESQVAVAFPYRRLLLEESPRFQWVHGRFGVLYRLPRLGGTPIAPSFDGSTAVSRYSRTDQVIDSYFSYRGDAFVSIQLLFRPLRIGLGGGVSYTRVFDVIATEDVGELEALRYVARLEAQLALRQGRLRRDQRTELASVTSVSFADGGDMLIDTRLKGQVVFPLGRSELLLRGRGIWMSGDVRFWDEEPLAGGYLRTFFDNRYWVQEAAQATIDYRLALTEAIKVGVFHDAALFGDRSGDGTRSAAIANSFGPALHFLVFDLLALDLYYGFGFSPSGFEHNFSFSLRNAF